MAPGGTGQAPGERAGPSQALADHSLTSKGGIKTMRSKMKFYKQNRELKAIVNIATNPFIDKEFDVT